MITNKTQSQSHGHH